MNKVATKQCSVHDNRVGYVCLFKGCDTSFLCRKCYKDHPEDHEHFLKELHELQENSEWTQTYENERDLLVFRGKEVYSWKDNMISKYRTCLGEMIDQIAITLERHKRKLLQDLVEMMDGDHLAMEGNLLLNLEENMKTLQAFDFREGDDIEKVILIKEFNEKIAPSAKSVIDSIEKKLEDCKLDELKVDRCKAELIEFIESVRVKNLCHSNPFQSLKDNDALSALTRVNQELIQSLEVMKRQVEELKAQNSNLEAEKEELIKIRNQLKSQLDNSSGENIILKDQNIDLSNLLTSLNDENKNIQRKIDELKAQNSKLNENQSGLKTENEELLEMTDLLKSQIDGLSGENIKMKNQNTQLKQKVTDLTNKLANLTEEIRVLRDQAPDLYSKEYTLELEKGPSFSWTWSSTQKSSKISLSENSIKATKTSGRNYAGVVGSIEMSHGCFLWEIEVSCAGSDKSNLVFGVTKPGLIKDIENIIYWGIVGLALNGNALQAKIENKLECYDKKIYLCNLDCDTGTFTISHAGIVICRQEGDLRNKALVPIVVLYEPGSTATLHSIV